MFHRVLPRSQGLHLPCFVELQQPLLVFLVHQSHPVCVWVCERVVLCYVWHDCVTGLQVKVDYNDTHVNIIFHEVQTLSTSAYT